MRHEYVFLINIRVSSSVTLLTLFPFSGFLYYDPHTHFMSNVNMENMKVVFRASRFPGKHILHLVKCLSLQGSCLNLFTFPVGDTNNKCICFESCVLCTELNVICYLSLFFNSCHIHLKITVNFCYQLISIKVATQKLAMNETLQVLTTNE